MLYEHVHRRKLVIDSHSTYANLTFRNRLLICSYDKNDLIWAHISQPSKIHFCGNNLSQIDCFTII